MATQSNTTLAEVLAALGISHCPSDIEGKREWRSADGQALGAFDAHDGWAEARRLMALRPALPHAA